jgi:hypothetical protein
LPHKVCSLPVFSKTLDSLHFPTIGRYRTTENFVLEEKQQHKAVILESNWHLSSKETEKDIRTVANCSAHVPSIVDRTALAQPQHY